MTSVKVSDSQKTYVVEPAVSPDGELFHETVFFENGVEVGRDLWHTDATARSIGRQWVAGVYDCRIGY